VRELVRQEYPTVVGALMECLGRAGLFAALWTSAAAETSYPLDRTAVSDVVNRGVTGSKLDAWQWIDEGAAPD
jgi:hypothetical protein